MLVSQFKIQQGQGFIFCLSSMAGASAGWDSHDPYVTEKAGVIGFVHRHATELGERNIRSNGATPRLIITAQPSSVEHSVGAERLGSLALSVPKGRIDDTEDIANVVSPCNSLLTETLDHLIGSHYASPEPT